MPPKDVMDVFGNARSRRLTWSYVFPVALMVATHTDPLGDQDTNCHWRSQCWVQKRDSLLWTLWKPPSYVCKIFKKKLANNSCLIFWILFVFLCRRKKVESFYFLWSLSDTNLVCAEKKIEQNRVPAWKNFLKWNLNWMMKCCMCVCL